MEITEDSLSENSPICDRMHAVESMVLVEIAKNNENFVGKAFKSDEEAEKYYFNYAGQK